MASARVAANVMRAAGVGVLVVCLMAGQAIAAPDDDDDNDPPPKAAACLSKPKATAPKGERWYYRVERGTKRHCWYTRAEGSKRMSEPAQRPVPSPKVAEPVSPPQPPQLEQSVANARAEADLSATASISTIPDAPREPEPHNWKLAERWSDHQTGGAPFEAKPLALSPALQIAPPEPLRTDEISMRSLIEIAGGAFGFAGVATVLVMTFARRRRQEPTSDFALFRTIDDPKRRMARRSEEAPQNLRPRLDQGLDQGLDHGLDGASVEEDMPMRAFTPRNLRATNAASS